MTHESFPHYYYQQIMLGLQYFASDAAEADDIRRRWGDAISRFEMIEPRKTK